MSNEKPIKLDMSFKEALQLIAKGGKVNSAKSLVSKIPTKGTAQKKQKRPKGA